MHVFRLHNQSIYFPLPYSQPMPVSAAGPTGHLISEVKAKNYKCSRVGICVDGRGKAILYICMCITALICMKLGISDEKICIVRFEKKSIIKFYL